MFYKNVSYSVKTFHGVTFKPGEIKEVDKYINNKFMIPADGIPNKTDNKLPQEDNTQQQQKPSSDKPKKSADTKKEPSSNKQEDPKSES